MTVMDVTMPMSTYMYMHFQVHLIFYILKTLLKLLPVRLMPSFRLERKETGLCKPRIFLGLPQMHSSGLLGCLAINHMHIITINLPDLLIGLWRGTIDCNKKDSKDLWDWLVLVGDI